MNSNSQERTPNTRQILMTLAHVSGSNPDEFQHLVIGEDGLLPALGISASDLQVVLLGNQERLGLAMFCDRVFKEELQCQAALQP